MSDLLKPPTQDECTVMSLAHEGTAESVKQLEKYIKNESDESKRIFAQIALDEAKWWYFCPEGDEEKRDELLCELIVDIDDDLLDLSMKKEEQERQIKEDELKGEVHKKLMKKSPKDVGEDWDTFGMSEDYLMILRHDLDQIAQKIAYKKAWIDQAKNMITSEKYKNKDIDPIAYYGQTYHTGDGIGSSSSKAKAVKL